MNKVEKSAWTSFKNATEHFLGNKRSDVYEKIVAKMVCSFNKSGCLINLKLHFLDSHTAYFPENLGDYRHGTWV